ncbi:MAG: EamA family transporter [Candidatus Nanohalarchaeota archaeon]|nr:MAG: EamA family transporter [Candidatus Nanohaloarchaeota archaeon]
MLWILFAFLGAFSESMKDVFSKKALNNIKNIDEYVAAWSMRFFALPFLLSLLLFVEIPVIGDGFWSALLLSGGLNTITTILYMKALKLSDLSVTVPMVTFTPLFLLITSPLIVREFPGLFGVLGIILIVTGAYMLNIKKRRDGFFEPFRALLHEKGPRLMLCVAFIWSITSNFDKIGVMNSSPVFWTASLNLFLTMTLLPVMLLKSQSCAAQVKNNIKALLPIGFFTAMMHIFIMTALSMTLVAYVISIKRTNALFAVLWGALFFKEKDVKGRLLGALIMIAGVVLITLF